MTDHQYEAYFTRDRLEKLLSTIDEKTVLVGGQALAFWADYLSVPILDPALGSGVSSDADFLGDRDAVKRMADGIHGKAIYPSKKALTSLVGQVIIPLADDEFLNVDVINNIVGIDADAVRRRALDARFGSVQFRVMHPLDVLQSRLENLARIADKRTPEGIAQACLAVQVSRSYITSIADTTEQGQKSASKAVEKIINLGKSGAGKSAQKKYGLCLLDAIPPHTIKNKNFHATRWPQLIDEFVQPEQSLISAIGGNRLTIESIEPDSGQYSGRICWQYAAYALQEIGRHAGVIHDLRVLHRGNAVEEGQSVSIKYQGGQGKISPKVNTRSH